MNDRAAGWRGVYKTEPVIGVGTTGEGKEGQDYFPGGFRLVSARSNTTSGYRTVHRSPGKTVDAEMNPTACLASRQNRA